ncbi:UNVERIFIED_CONTAM: IS30 family transposase [Paenibacillus sp. PvR008]
MYKQGWSARAIARELGRHHSTVSRELYRIQQDGSEEAAVFQYACDERRKYQKKIKY